MKYISALLIIAVCLTVSCTRQDDKARVSEVLDEALLSLQRQDYDEAVRLCDEVMMSSDTIAMTWKEYCQAATVYAAVYEHDPGAESSMASATLCLRRAMELNPDSSNVFIGMLSPQDAGSLNTVVQTLNGLSVDRSTIGDHEEDFVLNDTLNIKEK